MSLYSEAMDKLMERNAAIYAAQKKANQMTTELTLREKVLKAISRAVKNGGGIESEETLSELADLLSATGAPAYIRVADDLRGVVREEGEGIGYIKPYLQSSGEVVFQSADIQNTYGRTGGYK